MPKPTIASALCAGCLLLIAASPAGAHPISISRGSVYVTRQNATATIEIFLEDLYLFHALKTNREDYLEPAVIERGIELHREFLRKRFEITDVEGKRIEPISVEVIEAELPERGVPLAELMAHQLVFQLRYEFSIPPNVLHFTQRFTDEKLVLPSEMNLQIKQESAGATIEHTLLPGEPVSQRIDWDNPPLSPQASERERAQWEAREKKALLGITSQSSVYSFLYIEDFEVRHEILAPLLSLVEDLAITAEPTAVIPVPSAVIQIAEQDELRRQIETYFASGNPVWIDGQEAVPEIQRCDFYALDTTDFAQPANPRPLPVAGARVGVILSYRLGRRPTTVRMTWDRFNEAVWGVTTVVIAGETITRKKLSRVGNRNVVDWQRSQSDAGGPELNPVAATHVAPAPVSVPWLGCMLAAAGAIVGVLSAKARRGGYVVLAIALLTGAAATWSAPRADLPPLFSPVPDLSDAEAGNVFGQVLNNMYQSFAYRTEESIYDALAVSVDGDLLREIYLEVRRGLEMEDQGGARARIRHVQPLQTRRVDGTNILRGSFRLQCRWNVTGTVEHWGHLHERTNQYQARFTVAPVDGNWKLTGMELLDEQRIGSETSLRSFQPERD